MLQDAQESSIFIPVRQPDFVTVTLPMPTNEAWGRSHRERRVPSAFTPGRRRPHSVQHCVAEGFGIVIGKNWLSMTNSTGTHLLQAPHKLRAPPPASAGTTAHPRPHVPPRKHHRRLRSTRIGLDRHCGPCCARRYAPATARCSKHRHHQICTPPRAGSSPAAQVKNRRTIRTISRTSG